MFIRSSFSPSSAASGYEVSGMNTRSARTVSCPQVNPIHRPNPGWIYRSLGVEPLINCAGVRTSYGGCNPSERVLDAMRAAAEAFVDIEELNDCVGRELAKLTGAQWGFISAGSAAGITLAVAGAIAGNDPEKMVMLPHNTGKTVIIPHDNRTAYEAAIRAAGADIRIASSSEEIKRIAARRNAAAIFLVRSAISASSVEYSRICEIGRRFNIPIIVDAAGSAPQFPDQLLSSGASITIYSIGKYLRGPQSTGLVLGCEALCRAAYRNGPPFQSFGRSLKVGKDEIVGAYVAIHDWVESSRRQQWTVEWLDHLTIIEQAVRELPGVQAKIAPADDIFHNPRLQIILDKDLTPVTGFEIAERLRSGEPRIVLNDYSIREQSFFVDPANLSAGEPEVVAEALVEVITNTVPPTKVSLGRPVQDISGEWLLDITFSVGSGIHRLELETSGNEVRGVHYGERHSGACLGKIDGTQIELRSKLAAAPMDLYYHFAGRIGTTELAGTVQMGAATATHAGGEISSGLSFKRQYGTADWKAVRTSGAQTIKEAHA
ncbi:PLP-dependent transferase (plasmid) [Sinorhizobium numidicum]|uniref:PLP-dependent transferase n=1 Tax=Sinorhizobium numidicum TaxID=680248 RepID=A0ABY8D346_9HYPH|nr:PLP-dependent transferase [Sinorhizobium numidicum]WEX79325.1 PLP-dependent transferase [Sinorhizobium numidicum]WEX85304.1 PLP-dependent transferase [Sinorhizobium numidicum]